MRTEIEIQNENVEILLKLIKENPDLRIVPMVDSEIVADDGFSSWLGSFGKSEIDYIWVTDERIYFKSIDEEELIENEMDKIDDESKLIATILHESHPLWKPVGKRAEERVENYDWEKVIAVWISTP